MYIIYVDFKHHKVINVIMLFYIVYVLFYYDINNTQNI